MTSKTWNATDYDGQRAFGILPPQVTQAWVDSYTPEWWRKTQK